MKGDHLKCPVQSKSHEHAGGTLMLKQRIEYQSTLDALIAVTKRLSLYENQQQMNSAEFFDRYNRGEIADDREMIEWAID